MSEKLNESKEDFINMPTETGQTYQCKICGNKVKVIEAGGGQLVCCGVPMKLQDA
jgi:desulfoferrodoxin-like iron-binding protein